MWKLVQLHHTMYVPKIKHFGVLLILVRLLMSSLMQLLIVHFDLSDNVIDDIDPLQT